MANVLLPFYTVFYSLGVTVDLINYTDVPHTAIPIFDISKIVTNPTSTLIAAYHVLSGDNLPASAFGLPVDAGLRNVFGTFEPSVILPALYIRDPDTVKILVTARHITEEQSLDKGAAIVSGWQNIAKNHTHYVDKFLYGVSCYGLFKVKSNVTGDVQIIQKIITDVMGTTGQVTNDTINLWRKARKAFKESPDIRGTITEGFSVVSTNGNLQLPGGRDIDSFLEAVPNIPKLAPWSRFPSLISYRQLHDLDEQFPKLEKNLKTEEYLVKLNYIIEDLRSTQKLYAKLFEERLDLHNETLNKLKEFQTHVSTTFEALRILAAANHSIYKELTDKETFQKAFNQYESGLDKTTRSYYVALKKLYETLVVRCEEDFLAPTTGYLKVEGNEVISKNFLFGNITKCQDYCLEDERCRAFGFVDIDSSHATIFSGKGQVGSPLLPLSKMYKSKKCSIFYRSTSTATLIHPKGFFEGILTYDRKCHYEWTDN